MSLHKIEQKILQLENELEKLRLTRAELKDEIFTGVFLFQDGSGEVELYLSTDGKCMIINMDSYLRPSTTTITAGELRRQASDTGYLKELTRLELETVMDFITGLINNRGE